MIDLNINQKPYDFLLPIAIAKQIYENFEGKLNDPEWEEKVKN